MDENIIAVADLGTNTFQFLIAKVNPDGQEILFEQQDPVKLGEGGINKGMILSEPFERGITSMQKFADLVKAFKANPVRAIATSALRNADNGQVFINTVQAKTGIAIELISGEEEAQYIYKGILASGCLTYENSLIIDIGGGSVEFIIGSKQGIIWKQSFEVGCARLMDTFHKIDPIPDTSIAALNHYLDASLTTLFTEIDKYPVVKLIGSSGSFETFAVLLEQHEGRDLDIKTQKTYCFDINGLSALLGEIIKSSHADRVNNKGIIPVRVDMLVSAALITRYILDKLAIKHVEMTTNSLKEGVLFDMLGPKTP